MLAQSDERTANRPTPLECPLGIFLRLLGNKWRALVLWRLSWGAKGYYQLLRAIEGLTSRRLTQELGDLERAGLITKRTQPGGLGAQYCLTPLGERFKLVLGSMYLWALQNVPPNSSDS